MTTDNSISEFSRKSSESKEVTLDHVIQDMDQWRTSKEKRGEPIPTEIWKNIFTLLKKFPDTTVCTALGLTKMQLQRKRDEQSSSASTPTRHTEFSAADFCEVKQMPLYQPGKIPATNTLVVEFCRADGRIMKIHSTTDSFSELMKAFFSGG
jgi:hypothetical protein